jgi:hypothetical protein
MLGANVGSGALMSTGVAFQCRKHEAATFGYPRVRSFGTAGPKTFGYPRQAPF